MSSLLFKQNLILFAIQSHFEPNFQHFDAFPTFENGPLIGQPQISGKSQYGHTVSPLDEIDGNGDINGQERQQQQHMMSVDGSVDDTNQGAGRSSSEEKDSMTPAQSRRKAQNRAAYVMRRSIQVPHILFDFD